MYPHPHIYEYMYLHPHTPTRTPTHTHTYTHTHVSVPKRASPFRRRRPRVARLAGVRFGICVQREHRRVEHRVSHHIVCGMRLFRPGGAPPQAGRARWDVDAGRAVVRGGAAGARARACAQPCGHAHARVSPGVRIAARTNDGLYVCMYRCIRIYIYICRYRCTCARDGYGHACGCAACDAHERAIARADDAAVAITCACGYVHRYI
jgi:hypothetical protein